MAARDRAAPMTVIQHLEDLRRALTIAAAAWLLCSVIAWFFADDVLRLIKLRSGLQHSFVYLEPTGGFTIKLKLALCVGTVAASPVIFREIWWFVSPGLRPGERRVALPLVGAATLFFVLGVGACFYALPLIIQVLNGLAPRDLLEFLPSGDGFLSFLLGLCLAFGLVFQLPVVLWTLGMLRVISAEWLWTNRFYWVSGLGLLANFMAPGGDPFVTPMVVFVPLLVFYLGSTLVLKLTGR